MSSGNSDPVMVSSVRDIREAVVAAAEEGGQLTAARYAGDAMRLDLSGMNRVVDYPARDMTITVEAGLTVETLQRTLAEEGQLLPVDTGDPSMSVGAFVASDLSGPRQYGYGTLRDYLIGMEAVDGQGRVFHAGGRVVKNVAGYDFCRLAVGSRGAIGLLTQLTFKLKPMPVHSVLHEWSFGSAADASSALECLNLSSARPVVLDLVCGETWSIVVGLDGPVDVCEWQVEQIHQELAIATGARRIADGTDGALQWCAEVTARHTAEDSIIVRTRPSQVTRICEQATNCGATCHSHAGSGVVVVCAVTVEELPELRLALQKTVEPLGGFLVERASSRPLASVSSWSQRTAAAFDPSNVFASS